MYVCVYEHENIENMMYENIVNINIPKPEKKEGIILDFSIRI